MPTSCKKKLFTETELKIIKGGDENHPFRVLTILDENDIELLRKVSDDIELRFDDPDLDLFIKRLKKTLEIENGVGIAAPQVGINKNIFLFVRLDLPDQPVIVAINPKIINHPEETICFEGDGCLSIPDYSDNSIRYPWVEVEYYNENGELIKEKLEGYSREDTFSAVIFQHEYDHLQGILFIEKLYEELEFDDDDTEINETE